MAYLLIAALTFGVMFLVDKGFTKVFRSQDQHRSGTAVRLSKGYGVGAVLLCVLAVMAIVQYIAGRETVMLVGGILVGVVGIGLGVYYLTVGIFYDDEGFVYTSFGRKSVTYRYADINGQKLYVLQGGSNMVELYMADGKTVNVQCSMPGAYDFLDKACHARFRQLGINSFECDWFDEGSSCWFPPVEE